MNIRKASPNLQNSQGQVLVRDWVPHQPQGAEQSPTQAAHSDHAHCNNVSCDKFPEDDRLFWTLRKSKKSVISFKQQSFPSLSLKLLIKHSKIPFKLFPIPDQSIPSGPILQKSRWDLSVLQLSLVCLSNQCSASLSNQSSFLKNESYRIKNKPVLF